jgi:phosphoglycerate dehydrogenase-like enzyme
MTQPLRVGVTRDFLKPDGSLGFGDIGLAKLESQPGITWEFLADNHAELPAQVADQYDALLVLAPRVTRQTVAGSRRLAVVARFGVGYDTVDVPACTENGVLLTITPGGVRRPMATSALAFLLALSHKMLIKDRLTRAGRWADRLDHNGVGLTGKTLGVIGLGNIGREVFRLAQPLEMRHVGHDPFVSPETAAAAGIEWLPLDEMLKTADFVVVTCALTPETRHLLNAARLALLQPTAFLISIARGPIVDQAALTRVLQEGRIAGAALDVFEQEPIDPHDPILKLDNVIVAPHAICWTDEMFLGNGREACQSILDFAAGRVPHYVVNRDLLQQLDQHPKLRKLATS